MKREYLGMMLAVINIYSPGIYEKYIKKNVNILINANIFVLLVVNDEESVLRLEYKINPFNDDHIIIKKNRSGTMPAVGFNQGMKLALKKNLDYCFFIDQDSQITSETLSEIAKSTKHLNRFSFLATRVIDERSKKTLRYFRGNLTKSMTFFSISEKHYYKLPKINAAGYSGIVVNMQIIKRENLFINEKMGIELDDYDFTYRLSKVAPGYLLNTAIVTHPNKKEKRNNKIGELVDSVSLLYYLNRSGRERIHVQNYRYMISTYGKGMFKYLKIFFMNSTFFERCLKKLKR